MYSIWPHATLSDTSPSVQCIQFDRTQHCLTLLPLSSVFYLTAHKTDTSPTVQCILFHRTQHSDTFLSVQCILFDRTQHSVWYFFLCPVYFIGLHTTLCLILLSLSSVFYLTAHDTLTLLPLPSVLYLTAHNTVWHFSLCPVYSIWPHTTLTLLPLSSVFYLTAQNILSDTSPTVQCILFDRTKHSVWHFSHCPVYFIWPHKILCLTLLPMSSVFYLTTHNTPPYTPPSVQCILFDLTHSWSDTPPSVQCILFDRTQYSDWHFSLCPVYFIWPHSIL